MGPPSPSDLHQIGLSQMICGGIYTIWSFFRKPNLWNLDGFGIRRLRRRSCGQDAFWVSALGLQRFHRFGPGLAMGGHPAQDGRTSLSEANVARCCAVIFRTNVYEKKILSCMFNPYSSKCSSLLGWRRSLLVSKWAIEPWIGPGFPFQMKVFLLMYGPCSFRLRLIISITILSTIVIQDLNQEEKESWGSCMLKPRVRDRGEVHPRSNPSCLWQHSHTVHCHRSAVDLLSLLGIVARSSAEVVEDGPHRDSWGVRVGPWNVGCCYIYIYIGRARSKCKDQGNEARQIVKHYLNDSWNP